MPRSAREIQWGGRNLLGHDKRTPGDGVQRSNENIDPERTHLNRDYSTRKMGPSEAWDFAVSYAQTHSAKKMRDNAVVMSCDVIHLPKNWAEATGGAPEAEFFERVALPFLRERYSWADHLGQWPNEVSAVVHYDETKVDGHEGMPHLHYKYVPITSDGRTSHKEVNCRADLRPSTAISCPSRSRADTGASTCTTRSGPRRERAP